MRQGHPDGHTTRMIQAAQARTPMPKWSQKRTATSQAPSNGRPDTQEPYWSEPALQIRCHSHCRHIRKSASILPDFFVTCQTCSQITLPDGTNPCCALRWLRWPSSDPAQRRQTPPQSRLRAQALARLLNSRQRCRGYSHNDFLKTSASHERIHRIHEYYFGTRSLCLSSKMAICR